ncbi:hypothetical protein B0H12DRAFT_1158035 [Mycena haematopus]|nr:hypothetical protein B0H12DRAFT_1158035 [Mycena haematopus]
MKEEQANGSPLIRPSCSSGIFCPIFARLLKFTSTSHQHTCGALIHSSLAELIEHDTAHLRQTLSDLILVRNTDPDARIRSSTFNTLASGACNDAGLEWQHYFASPSLTRGCSGDARFVQRQRPPKLYSDRAHQHPSRSALRRTRGRPVVLSARRSTGSSFRRSSARSGREKP